MRPFQLTLVFLFFLGSHLSTGCTIFTSSSLNGVFAGNNEDMCTTNTMIHLIPAYGGNFGRILWGFKGDENYQGGMNEFGLFFDGASTPPVEMSHWNKPEFGERYIFEVVLEKCKTVQEAIDLVSQYSLPYLKYCHILVADASGDAAIFEWGNNKLNIIRKGDKNYLIATNFNITETIDPLKECARYAMTQKMLEGDEPSRTLYEGILSLTHVEGRFPTVYSNICDLKNKKVYLYNFHNYSFSKEIDLISELEKGEQKAMIRSFFTPSIAELMFRMMNDCIDSFENLPERNVTFHVQTKEPFPDAKLYIQGGGAALGDWEEPGVELTRLNENEFEISIPVKEGKMFDFTVASENNKYYLIDPDMKTIREKTAEVTSDTTIMVIIADWKKKK